MYLMLRKIVNAQILFSHVNNHLEVGSAWNLIPWATWISSRPCALNAAPNPSAGRATSICVDVWPHCGALSLSRRISQPYLAPTSYTKSTSFNEIWRLSAWPVSSLQVEVPGNGKNRHLPSTNFIQLKTTQHVEAWNLGPSGFYPKCLFRRSDYHKSLPVPNAPLEPSISPPTAKFNVMILSPCQTTPK